MSGTLTITWLTLEMMQDAKFSDERELVNGILQGNRNDFRIIIERTQNEIARIISRHVKVEDQGEVIQDTYVRAFQSLESFNFRSPLINWLSVIAVRTCHDYWRKRSKGMRHTAVLSEEIPADGPTEEGDIDSEKILSELNATDRMVLSLLYLEERSVKEVAAILNISVVNVKVRAYRARKRALKIYQEKNL